MMNPVISFPQEVYRDYLMIKNNELNRIFVTVQIWDNTEFEICIAVRPERDIFFVTDETSGKGLKFVIDPMNSPELRVGIPCEFPLDIIISYQERDNFPFQLIAWSQINDRRSEDTAICTAKIRNTQQPFV